MAYSAVTQPLPLPRIQRGTSSSTGAVHRTIVSPSLHQDRARPGAVKSRWKLMGGAGRFAAVGSHSSYLTGERPGAGDDLAGGAERRGGLGLVRPGVAPGPRG